MIVGNYKFAAGVQGKIPLKRFGDAADVARAVMFLARSADSGFVSSCYLSARDGTFKLLRPGDSIVESRIPGGDAWATGFA